MNFILNYSFRYEEEFLENLKNIRDSEYNTLNISYNYESDSSNIINNINIIVNELSKFRNIRISLDLSNLKMEYIPENIFKLVYLRRLDLSSNMLKTISPNINKLVNLKFLIIEDNLISTFPKVICELKNLIYINIVNMDGNYGKNLKIPLEISKLEKLETVIGYYKNKNKYPIYDLQKLQSFNMLSFNNVIMKRLVSRLFFIMH